MGVANVAECLALVAPPVAAVVGKPLRQGLPRVLNQLSVEEAQLAYEAIRRANPAGLGEVPDQDVRRGPTQTLRQVMTQAADRDLIACSISTVTVRFSMRLHQRSRERSRKEMGWKKRSSVASCTCCRATPTA